jgi:hypothetical protein
MTTHMRYFLNIFVGILASIALALQATADVPVIKGASYYLNNSWHRGGKDSFESCFYTRDGKILNRISRNSAWNPAAQKDMDAMIDPTAESLQLTSAEIHTCPIRGRFLKFYNSQKQLFTYTTHGGCIRDCIDYKGPIDLKKAEHDYNLIKPHSVLQNLQKVQEYDLLLPASFMNIIPCAGSTTWLFPYLKKELIYNDDGTTTERTTVQHRIKQGAKVALGLGALYVTYTYFIRAK